MSQATTVSEHGEKELPPKSLSQLKMWLVELKRHDILDKSDFHHLSQLCHELKRRYHENSSMDNREAAASGLHNDVCDRTPNLKAHRLARRVIQDVMDDVDAKE